MNRRVAPRRPPAICGDGLAAPPEIVARIGGTTPAAALRGGAGVRVGPVDAVAFAPRVLWRARTPA